MAMHASAVLSLAAASSSAAAELYCPTATDLAIGYGNVTLVDGGWTIQGSGTAAMKSTFNLLGGSFEFDINVANVDTGVNANLYSIFPHISGSEFQRSLDYCDGAEANDHPWCPELDVVESNGDCGGQTTFHTVEGPGDDGCTSWGCKSDFAYQGKTTFHMLMEFDLDGTVSVHRNGAKLTGFTPQPDNRASDMIMAFHESTGALIMGSQWVGWVPGVGDCSTAMGDLEASSYDVRNLKITGKVMQGPVPSKCADAVSV